ncbi:MAG: VOC family protein [Gammaproteobacteria bacterium]|nr:VOC family protein [Gammaproteobacteria bacterium]
MINVLGIDHIVIRAKNAALMIDFYKNILGCAVERDMSAEFGLTQLRAGRSLIDIVSVDSILGRKGGPAPESTGNNLDHFCLQIEKIDEAVLTAFLVKQNVAVSDFERRYGAEGYGRSIYINDPEGNVVELKGVDRIEHS